MTEESQSGPPARRSAQTPARRFGDAEVRRILEAAATLQERSGSSDGGRGLTLAELRQVASEVGIDPGFVDVAASRVDLPAENTASRAAGGPVRWHYRASVPGEIAHGDLDRILQVIRTTLNEKGEVSEVWGRIEWSHDEVGSTIVGVVSRDGSTEFDVSATKTDEATVIHFLGVAFGGIFGGAALSSLLGISGAGVLPLIGLMAGVSYGATRLGWKARSAWWERRLKRLVDALCDTAHDIAQLPAAGSGPGDGPGLRPRSAAEGSSVSADGGPAAGDGAG